MRFRVVFMRSGTVGVYCRPCLDVVISDAPEWAWCALPRAVLS
jgi:hypothetical protein